MEHRSGESVSDESRTTTRVLDVMFGLWAGLTIALAIALPPPTFWDETWLITIALVIAAAILGTAMITVEYGAVNMSGVVTCTAIIVLWPAQAALIGWVGGGYHALLRRRRSHVPLNFSQSLWASSGAVIHHVVDHWHLSAIEAGSLALAAGFLVNLGTTSALISLVTHEGTGHILRRTVTMPFLLIFTYFAFAGALAATVVQTGPLGLVQGLGMYVLGIPVADSIGGRRIRRFLERQLKSVDQQVHSGELAKGTLHNVRNSLSVALASLEQITALPDPKQNEALVVVRLSLEETQTTLSRALVDGSGATLTFVRLEVGELTRQTTALLRASTQKAGVGLTVLSRDYPVYVFGHPGLLRELLTNLVLNAVDACGIGCTITVEYAVTGTDVAVTVRDTGHGLPRDTAHRIFEPGFSTKGSPGTGLGLYTSLGIARQHGGDLKGSNRPGGGAIFTLTLPLYERGRALLESASL